MFMMFMIMIMLMILMSPVGTKLNRGSPVNPGLCEEPLKPASHSEVRAEQTASRGVLLSRFLTCAGKFW